MIVIGTNAGTNKKRPLQERFAIVSVAFGPRLDE
jgi:hypothetical protein